MKTKSNNNCKNLFGKSGYKAFFAPWCGVILIALLISSPVFGSMGRPYSVVSLPDVKNYQFVEQRGQYPTIVIDQTGKVWLDGCELTDDTKAVIIIEDRMEELKCYKKKVFLKADESVQFGKIVEVLDLLSKAGIKVVAFITDEYAAPIHFFKDLKKIWAAN
jgi:biopolymer transport protein ExbD